MLNSIDKKNHNFIDVQDGIEKNQLMSYLNRLPTKYPN